MDELEIRRRLLTDPHSRDPKLQQQIAQSSSLQQYQQELQQLDQKVQQNLQCPVPADLADRILLAQHVNTFAQKKQRQKRLYLMAAAVFAIALLAPQLYQQLYWPQQLGEHSLAHVYHELDALNQPTTPLDVNEVNQLLASFGAEFIDLHGTISYARFCDFQGQQSLHLIVHTAQGPMTVFVLPPEHPVHLEQQFQDERFHGQSVQVGQRAFVVVAAKQVNLTPMVEKVTQTLRFHS